MIVAVSSQTDADQDLGRHFQCRNRSNTDSIFDRVSQPLFITDHQRIRASVDDDNRVHGVFPDKLAVQSRQRGNGKYAGIVGIDLMGRIVGELGIQERTDVHFGSVCRSGMLALHTLLTRQSPS